MSQPNSWLQRKWDKGKAKFKSALGIEHDHQSSSYPTQVAASTGAAENRIEGGGPGRAAAPGSAQTPTPTQAGNPAPAGSQARNGEVEDDTIVRAPVAANAIIISAPTQNNAGVPGNDGTTADVQPNNIAGQAADASIATFSAPNPAGVVVDPTGPVEASAPAAPSPSTGANITPTPARCPSILAPADGANLRVPAMSHPVYEDVSVSEKQIRLLSFTKTSQSSLEGSQLACSLLRVDRESAPPYTALSYTWGDQSQQGAIALNGKGFLVGKNLEAALHELQKEVDCERVWIDAICINQQDNEEKAHQIGYMRHIYENAENVAIWLGEADGLTKLSTKTAGELGKLLATADYTDENDLEGFVRMVNFFGCIPPLYFRMPIGHCIQSVGSDLNMMKDLVLGVNCILDQPWWTRVWVQQEFSAARRYRFLWGEYRLSGESLALTCDFLKIAFHVFPRLREAAEAGAMPVPALDKGVAQGTRRQYRQSHTQMKLFELLTASYAPTISFFRLDASNPRDRIFALLGLAADRDELAIPIDYSGCWEDTYAQTAAALLLHGHVDTLLLCQGQGRHDTLPSWVPDWTAPLTRPCGGYAHERLFSASGKSTPLISAPASTTEAPYLQIAGYFLDTIVEAGPNALVPAVRHRRPVEGQLVSITASLNGDDADSITATRQFVEDIINFAKAPVESDRSVRYDDNLVLDTLSAGQEYVRASSGFRRISDEVGRWGCKNLLKSMEEDREEHPVTFVRDGVFLYLITVFSLPARRAFLTREGYIGTGPPDLAPGDKVFVFLGFHVPAILRPAGAGRFRILGDAYVHGMMDGEILSCERELTTFELI